MTTGEDIAKFAKEREIKTRFRGNHLDTERLFGGRGRLMITDGKVNVPEFW